MLSQHRISEPEQAREFGLKAAEKKESQDFISPEYLPELFSDKPSVPGDIIDIDGHVLGRHNGIEHYTIGQRKGLGISAKYPIYVHSIDAVNNLIVVSKEEDLFSQSFIAEDFVWAGGMIPEDKGKGKDTSGRKACGLQRGFRLRRKMEDQFHGTPEGSFTRSVGGALF